MHGVREIVRHEGGVAVVLALVALLPLTALVVVLLTMSAFEPQIASNLAATNQAQYLAEAGIEAAFDALASTVNWSAVLAGPPAATCTVGVVAPGTVQGAVLPGLSASAGTYTVRVRNDCFSNARSNPSSDSALTGVPLDASATVDTNDRLILTSTGTIGTAMRTNTVVIRKVSFPPIRAALAFPGVGANVDFSGSFAIRGVDTNQDGTNGPGSAVLGLAVGVVANEADIEIALQNNPQTSVEGKSQVDPATTTRGPDTVAFDAALTSQAVIDFVNAVRQTADIKIAAGARGFSIRNIGSACDFQGNGIDCWGTDSRPKVVYVKGSSDERVAALDVSGTSMGSGLLIVEDGTVALTGDFRWNGPVILSGRNVGIRYYGGGNRDIYGAVVVNETRSDGPPNLEADMSGTATLSYSTQALANAMTAVGNRRLMTLYNWQDQ